MLRLAARLKREHARKLLRVCWPARAKAEIAESVLRYCVTSGRTLAAHQRRFSRQDIEVCSVIVTTMLGASEISRVGVGIEGFPDAQGKSPGDDDSYWGSFPPYTSWYAGAWSVMPNFFSTVPHTRRSRLL